MRVGPDLNEFALKEKIEEMIVYEQITMKNIYEMYENFKSDRTKIQSSGIIFFDCVNDYFSFEIGQAKGYDILSEPIIIKIEEKTIDIICESQIKFIKDKYKVDLIFCDDEKINIAFSLYNLKYHKNHKIIIGASDIFKIFQNQKEIDNFLKKYSGKFINQIFKTPHDFEKNYEYYFNINKKNKNNDFQFIVYEDNQSSNRYDLSKDIIIMVLLEKENL